jgi:hypothetical protein
MNKWLVLSAILFTGLSSYAENSLFSRYKVNQIFRLSNGVKLEMPYRSVANYLYLAGAVDSTKLNAILGKEDLVAVPNSFGVPDANGMTTVGVYVLDYAQSTVGAYREFLITTLAKSTKPVGVDRFGLYVLKISVTSELSAIAGREIGGYPKTLADIKAQYDGDMAFEVKGSKNESIVANCVGCGLLPMNTQELTFNLISPYALRKTWYEYKNLGPVGMKFFDPARDKFEANTNCPSGDLLKSLNFMPLYWFAGKNVEVVVSGGN